LSIGRELASKFRVRFDAAVTQFDHEMPVFPPCPIGGCTQSFYNTKTNGVIGLTANGLVNLDPRGIVYLIGGAGVYNAYVPSAELHIGVSAGAGIVVPVGARLHAFAEARWHDLFGGTLGPSWLVPITVGLRY
jgi:hypothetical protein